MSVTIDCDYMAPEVAAAYLLVDSGEAAFIETNTSNSVPRLLAALEAAGQAPESVRYIIITHIHLDHAGGAGELMQRCPNATLLAHPRAAPHAIDPSRIVAGATAVYGEAQFAELYGTIRPIDADRVLALDDDQTVDFAGRPLTFLHTRGHANHHFCVLDGQRGNIYTGDSFGIVYPALQTHGLFAFPSTSPTDFDGQAAIDALERILASGAQHACLTHFGSQSDLSGIADQLREMLTASMALVEHADAEVEDAALDAYMQGEIRALFMNKLKKFGLEDATGLLGLDIDLNAQGLAFAVRKRRFKRGRT